MSSASRVSVVLKLRPALDYILSGFVTRVCRILRSVLLPGRRWFWSSWLQYTDAAACTRLGSRPLLWWRQDRRCLCLRPRPWHPSHRHRRDRPPPPTASTAIPRSELRSGARPKIRWWPIRGLRWPALLEPATVDARRRAPAHCRGLRPDRSRRCRPMPAGRRPRLGVPPPARIALHARPGSASPKPTARIRDPTACRRRLTPWHLALCAGRPGPLLAEGAQPEGMKC